MIHPIMLKKIIGTIALLLGGFWIYEFFTHTLNFATEGISQLIFGVIAVSIGVIFHAT